MHFFQIFKIKKYRYAELHDFIDVWLNGFSSKIQIHLAWNVFSY